MSEILLESDGKEVNATEGMTVLEAAQGGDLPLFASAADLPPAEEFRLERVGAATLAFLVRLVRTAAARRGLRPIEASRRRDLVALAVPGGPALLAVTRRGGRWHALLALRGRLVDEVAAAIPAGAGANRAA